MERSYHALECLEMEHGLGEYWQQTNKTSRMVARTYFSSPIWTVLQRRAYSTYKLLTKVTIRDGTKVQLKLLARLGMCAWSYREPKGAVIVA